MFSRPIRCISRNRNTRTPSTVLKKSTLLVNKCNGLEEKSSEVKSNPVHEGKSFPPQKRVKLGLEKSASTLTTNPLLFHRPDEEGNSHAFNDTQVAISFTLLFYFDHYFLERSLYYIGRWRGFIIGFVLVIVMSLNCPDKYAFLLSLTKNVPYFVKYLKSS